jgi:hypothetical protein
MSSLNFSNDFDFLFVSYLLAEDTRRYILMSVIDIAIESVEGLFFSACVDFNVAKAKLDPHFIKLILILLKCDTS